MLRPCQLELPAGSCNGVSYTCNTALGGIRSPVTVTGTWVISGREGGEKSEMTMRESRTAVIINLIV